MEWLAKQHEATSQRELAVALAVVATEANILVRDKGKRNIVDRMEEEKR